MPAEPEDKIMKTSIATVCLSGGLSEKLQAIAAAGFRGVEIFESDLLSYNGTPADVAKEMSDPALWATLRFPGCDEASEFTVAVGSAGAAVGRTRNRDMRSA